MKRFLMSLIVLFIVPFYALAQPSIIPLPQEYNKATGIFNLNNNVVLVTDDNSLLDEAWYLQKELLRHKGIPVSLQAKRQNSSIILSKEKNSKRSNGAYTIKMNPSSVEIIGVDDEGVFNGIVSFVQMATAVDVKNNNLPLNCWNISDAPLYQWRGLMLDESRHFFGKEKVKSLLDWMAFYKLNKFHWHLTDEPGWRIQIKKYPFLSLIGGIGSYTDSLAPTAYYTQEDIKEVVAYAAERKIEVIPEIDMHGHARAANRAYPQFSGGGSAKYPDFTFDPGNPATYQYLTDILKEINALFPSQMIHLGGDEVSFGNEKWNSNPGVQSLMKQHNLKNLKDVEDYFLQRMADSVLKLNSKVLAWDEMATALLPAAQSIIFWWRHDKPAQLQAALKNNYPVVLCPRIPFYFDFVQDSSHNVGRKWAGTIAALKDVYTFDASKFVSENQKPLVLGVQANVWTEHMKTEQRLDYMIFPRISALAETAWSSKGKNYSDFLNRLKNHLKLFKQDGIYYFDPLQALKYSEPEL